MKNISIAVFVYLSLISLVWADRSGKITDVAGTPLANVCVSDGRNVVATNADGEFQLPENAAARFVFVSVPSGYKVRGKFYRPTIDATEFDFVLERFPNSEGETVRFIQVSDVEQRQGDLRWRDAIRDYLQTEPCAFFVSSGDICYPEGLKFCAENVNEETLGVPTFHSIGNHDLVAGKYGEELYESLFGPCWYSFNAGPVHFVVTPMPGGDYRPSYSTVQVAEWLKNDLATLDSKTPVIIFQHTAPTGDKFDAPASFRYGDVDLTKIRLAAWLFGHYHTSVFYTHPETGITFGSVAPPNKGGIDHSVASFYVVTLDASGIRSIDKRNSFWNKPSSEKPTVESSGESVLTSKWIADAGAEIHFCQPLSFESDVVVATADDGNRKDCAVVRFNSKGELLWKTPVENSIKSSLTADDRRIYATDQAWNVYALDAATGKILWQDRQGAEPTSLMVAPILKDGVLYAGQGGGLTAYDAATGERLWRNDAWRGGEGTTAGLAIVGDLLLASSNWRALYAHRLGTGELAWTAAHDHLRFRSSEPIPFRNSDGDDVLLVTNDKDIQTLDLKSGDLLQSVRVGQNLQTASVPLIFDDEILVGSADVGLCAYDRTNFEKRWNVSTGENLTYSSPYTSPVLATVEASPIRVGKFVVFGALDGVLYVVDPKRDGDKVVQKIKLDAPVLATASLATDGETVFVADFAGRVYAFDVRSEE